MLLWYNYSIDIIDIIMPSKKAFNADNQQERQKLIGWIVGFIDGEGCFSVSIFRNPTTSSGWQIFPELIVTQGVKSVQALRELKKFFQCGRIYINRRHDTHKEDLYRYCVRKLDDLENIIIPFFRQNSLKTAKADDFRKFARIVGMMRRREHLTKEGSIKIAKIIETMNRRKPAEFLSSPETIRQTKHSNKLSVWKI